MKTHIRKHFIPKHLELKDWGSQVTCLFGPIESFHSWFLKLNAYFSVPQTWRSEWVFSGGPACVLSPLNLKTYTFSHTVVGFHCCVFQDISTPLLRIVWARIILDEAHNVKNPRVQTSIAVCKLQARARWAVTGTPIQNNLLDMYSLLKWVNSLGLCKCEPCQ